MQVVVIAFAPVLIAASIAAFFGFRAAARERKKASSQTQATATPATAHTHRRKDDFQHA